MGLKVNKTAIAIVKQPVVDTFVTPVAADRYPCSNVNLQFNAVTVQNEEYTGSIHKNGDEVIGMNVALTFNIAMRPPGGVAPPAADAYVPGRLLQAAKFTEVIQAAAIPAAAEAIGATAPTATTFQLGATAVGTLDLYKGKIVSLSTEGATYQKKLAAIRSNTAGKIATVCDALSAGAPVVGTTLYQFPMQLNYQRNITATDPTKLSMSIWLDGVRFDLQNCVVSGFRAVINTSTKDQGSTPQFEVTITAQIKTKADEATPSDPALGPVPKFRDGKQHIAYKALGGASLSYDAGLRTGAPPNPNKANGSDSEELLESRSSLSVDLQMYNKAFFDSMSLADAQTQQPVYALWGQVAGGNVSLVIPDARFNYLSPQLGGEFVNETGDMFIDVFDKNVNINFCW
jgi:hypothetical protein